VAAAALAWCAAAGAGPSPLPDLSRAEPEWIDATALSPDGRVLATSCYDVVFFWDAATARRIGAVETGAEHMMGLAFDPTGRFLAAGSWDHSLLILDWQAGRVERALAAQNVLSVAFSPDGRLVAAGGIEDLRVWDVATGRLQQFDGASDGKFIAFSPNGERIALLTNTKSIDQRLDVWNVADARRVWSVVGDISGPLHYSPDGRLLASEYRRRPFEPPGGISPLSSSGTLPTRVSSGWPAEPSEHKFVLRRSVQLWDAESGARTRSFATPGPLRAFSPDGGTVAAAVESKPGELRILDASSGRQLARLHAGWRPWFVVLRQGEVVAVELEDCALRVWHGTY